MGLRLSPGIRYQLIQNTLEASNNTISVTRLCDLAGVSRSGFYKWLKNEPNRERKETQDLTDFMLIKRAFNYRGYKKGARSIHMVLLHRGIVMNVKKIRRLMKKYGLSCPIRRPSSYRNYYQENKVFSNTLNRNFKQAPRKVLLTDITYLIYAHGHCYLSTVIDAMTREVLAYRVSDSLEIQFVLDTVEELVEKYACQLDDSTIIHSDQGVHYTSKMFIEKIRTVGIIQSMSRRGNCWDNSPQENFFGHLKDEIKLFVSQAKTPKEVQQIVEDWIDYYNNERYQWDLLKLSPVQYYNYLKTGEDPLKEYRSTKNTGD